MTVYSFDKEFAVETKKSVNIGGQVQTINFTDNIYPRLLKVTLGTLVIHSIRLMVFSIIISFVLFYCCYFYS